MTDVRNIVILTGAGVSAESGVATFRGPGGLWEGHHVEDVCTPEALAADPVLVHRFYDERRAKLTTVEPNAAHHALARLDREWPGELLLAPASIGDITIIKLGGSETWSVGKDAFLACTQGIVSEYKSQGVTKAMFSGEGLFVYKISGQGILWCTSFGAIIRKDVSLFELRKMVRRRRR